MYIQNTCSLLILGMQSYPYAFFQYVRPEVAFKVRHLSGTLQSFLYSVFIDVIILNHNPFYYGLKIFTTH